MVGSVALYRIFGAAALLLQTLVFFPALTVWGEGARVGGGYDLASVRAVYFYEPGCPFCARFEKETLANPKVREGFAKLKMIKINAFTKEPTLFDGRRISQMALARELGVDFYPTVLFLGPDGVEIARIKGFFNTPDFLEMLGYITDMRFLEETFEGYLDRLSRINS